MILAISLATLPAIRGCLRTQLAASTPRHGTALKYSKSVIIFTGNPLSAADEPRLEHFDTKGKCIMLRYLVAAFALASAVPTEARTMTATPDSLVAQIKAARSGDVIALSQGDYGRVTITDRTFEDPLIIKAGTSQFQLVLNNVSGFQLRGGIARDNIGVAINGYSVSITDSDHIIINGLSVFNSTRGIVIGRTTDFIVTHVLFDGMLVDGINIAGSKRGVIQDIICQNANTGKEHPDCVQGWSRPGHVTQDVTVLGIRVMTAGTQGIFFGNHIRNGVDDGGFDRIRIIGNSITGDRAQGIGLYDCRNCEISRNVVTTMPGARFRVSINTRGSTGLVMANNRMVR